MPRAGSLSQNHTPACVALHGMVWHGVYGCALYGMLWYGMALYGMAWYCVVLCGSGWHAGAATMCTKRTAHPPLNALSNAWHAGPALHCIAGTNTST